MADLRALVELWPVFTGIVGGLIYLVSENQTLKGRIDSQQIEINQLKTGLAQTDTRLENLDSEIIERLGEVRESLARLEGALSVKLPGIGNS